MDARSIRLLEEKLTLVKRLIKDSNEISEESKLHRIHELNELENEIEMMKKS